MGWGVVRFLAAAIFLFIASLGAAAIALFASYRFGHWVVAFLGMQDSFSLEAWEEPHGAILFVLPILFVIVIFSIVIGGGIAGLAIILTVACMCFLYIAAGRLLGMGTPEQIIFRTIEFWGGEYWTGD